MKVYRQLTLATIAILVVVAAGTLGFWLFEPLNWFDALWMTVITLMTVGYGDVVPQTTVGRIFAMTLTPIGVIIAGYAIGVVTSIILDDKISGTFRRHRMEKAIGKLNGHVIICGIGRVGLQVMNQLLQENKRIVIVDIQASGKLKETPNILYIEGNATEDEVLYKAGIENAEGLITTLPEDADNVFVTLTAKGINPAIKVVARAERSESEDKLRRAGADKVINPSNIGGRRLAMSILRPFSVDYVDMVLHDHHADFGIEEIVLSDASVFVGRSLRESKIRENYGVTIVAIMHPGETLIHNPKADETMQPGDLLIVFGTDAQLKVFEKDCVMP